MPVILLAFTLSVAKCARTSSEDDKWDLLEKSGWYTRPSLITENKIGGLEDIIRYYDRKI